MLCDPLRPLGRAPAEAQSLRLSAAVAAAFGCVPRGQQALLDADINALIDWSSCLVEPVLVLSRARAVRTEYVRPVPRPVAAREYSHREALWKVLRSRSESLSVVVLAAASGTILLRALITTRCIPAAAHQVLVSCDMFFPSLNVVVSM